MSLPKLAFFQKFSQRKKYCFVATLVELACEYIIILYIYISVGSKCGNIGPGQSESDVTLKKGLPAQFHAADDALNRTS